VLYSNIVRLGAFCAVHGDFDHTAAARRSSRRGRNFGSGVSTCV
jgi:hypothetical protein